MPRHAESRVFGDHPIEVQRSTRRRKTINAYRRDQVIVVQVPARLRPAEIDQAVAELVPKVLAKETMGRIPDSDDALLARAERLVDTVLAEEGQQFPRPRSVRWVTNQGQRWGSCSTASRAIRLSHRLQAMPEWVVDYVLVHELAHLRHGDHSPEFWELVGRYPRAEEAKGYLQGWHDARSSIG